MFVKMFIAKSWKGYMQSLKTVDDFAWQFDTLSFDVFMVYVFRFFNNGYILFL